MNLSFRYQLLVISGLVASFLMSSCAPREHSVDAAAGLRPIVGFTWIRRGKLEILWEPALLNAGSLVFYTPKDQTARIALGESLETVATVVIDEAGKSPEPKWLAEILPKFLVAALSDGSGEQVTGNVLSYYREYKLTRQVADVKHSVLSYCA